MRIAQNVLTTEESLLSFTRKKDELRLFYILEVE